MTGGTRRPRANLARSWSVLTAMLVLCLFGGVVATAAGATVNPRALEAASSPAQVPYGPSVITDPNDIKVTIEDPHLAVFNGDFNKVTRDIVVLDRKSGARPEVHYGAFLTAQLGDDESTLTAPEDTTCFEQHYNSPTIPVGIYRCTIILNRPGVWTFTATINAASRVNTVGQRLATVQKAYNIKDAVVLKGDYKGLKYIVQGRLFEVFLLQSHVGSAVLWLLLTLMMAFLAVPRLRRTMSILTLHTLEIRRGFLNSVLWASYLTTLGTGIYLLTTETAYKAPFSISKWNTITSLPYAQTYFLALYFKILLFVVMGGATVVLVSEASRQAKMAGNAGSLDYEDDDAFWERMKFRDVEADELDVSAKAPEGSAATAVKAKPRTAENTGVSAQTLWVALGILLGGMAAVGVCVTILKYCHELIEQVAATKVLESYKIFGGS